jgi:hypothetical protein
MGSIGGQASGDFRLSQGALRILYSLIKDSIPVLSSDGFTQNNPNVVTTPSAKSTTLPVNVKKGVLGGSVAFTRPDVGQNTVGGAVLVAAAFVAKTRPLGLFINDSLGNANENTPGVASGKGPFLRGGSCGVKIYETAVQTIVGGGVVGTALTYSVGDLLYASVNGLLTNRWQDSYETQWITTAAIGGATGAGAAQEYDNTRMGVVLAPPDATSTEMFLELYF